MFRIDKDEPFGCMAHARKNFAQLLYAGRNGLFHLKQDIQYLDPPIEAMHKVLSTEGYTLIPSMSGTGMGHRCSGNMLFNLHMHSAEDPEGAGKWGWRKGWRGGFIRLGNVDKVHHLSCRQLEAQLMSLLVIATSRLLVRNLLSRRRFIYTPS